MICPHCQKDIPDAELAKHLGKKGGTKSKRVITPEQRAMMQEAQRKAALKRKLQP
jgi:general stress protein YciG